MTRLGLKLTKLSQHMLGVQSSDVFSVRCKAGEAEVREEARRRYEDVPILDMRCFCGILKVCKNIAGGLHVFGWEVNEPPVLP